MVDIGCTTINTLNCLPKFIYFILMWGGNTCGYRDIAWYVCVHMCVHICVCVHAVPVESEDKLVESPLSFHLYVGSKEQT